ncbi:MAG: hypothetical protein ACPGOY_10640 [Rhodospirillaceae bacterium]
MATAKIQKFPEGYGFIFPEELKEQLQFTEGDAVEVSINANGQVLIGTQQSDMETLQQYALEGMEDYKNALSELAK